jgi:hypothetical protein
MFLTDMHKKWVRVRLLSTALYLHRQFILFLLLPKLYCEWFCLLFTNHHLLGVSFVTRIYWNLCRTLNQMGHYRKDLYYLTCTELDGTSPNVFLTGTQWLLVASKGWSTFSGTNHCQGQLQAPQSFSVSVSTEKWALVVIHYWDGTLVRTEHGVEFAIKDTLALDCM